MLITLTHIKANTKRRVMFRKMMDTIIMERDYYRDHNVPMENIERENLVAEEWLTARLMHFSKTEAYYILEHKVNLTGQYDGMETVAIYTTNNILDEFDTTIRYMHTYMMTESEYLEILKTNRLKKSE